MTNPETEQPAARRPKAAPSGPAKVEKPATQKRQGEQQFNSPPNPSEDATPPTRFDAIIAQVVSGGAESVVPADSGAEAAPTPGAASPSLPLVHVVAAPPANPFTKASKAKKPVTSTQRRQYAKNCGIIHRGIKEMLSWSLEVGEALRQIKDNDLYLVKYKTFQEFCTKELAIAKSRAYELVGAAQVKREFSAMADLAKMPVNERQIRPLTSLRSPEERRAVWNRAVQLAGEEPVTEGHVRKALKALKAEAEESMPSEIEVTKSWRTTMKERFFAKGFERPFEQPIRWSVDAVDLQGPAAGIYLKLIELLTLPDVACAKAVKQAHQDALVIVSAEANATDNLIPSSIGDEDTVESFPPEFNIVAKELDVLIEYDGKFYRAGELDDKFHAVWTPLTPDELAELGLEEVAR